MKRYKIVGSDPDQPARQLHWSNVDGWGELAELFTADEKAAFNLPLGDNVRWVEAAQTYRLEVRWDFTGTGDEARAEAQRVASSLPDGEVTDIFDEDWDET